MKKILTVLVLFVSAFALLSFLNKTNADDVTLNEANQAVKNLFEAYYNEGEYIKNTKIYVDKTNENLVNEVAILFHGKKIPLLERTTEYTKDRLWMKEANSGYKTTESNMQHFKVVDGEDVVDYTVSGTTMEAYFVTLEDFYSGKLTAQEYETTPDLLGTWEVKDGIYYTKNENVLDAFRLFTAPLWLGTTSTNDNYITYDLAAVQVIECDLIMSLLVSTDQGKLDNAPTVKVNNQTYYAFSQATILAENIDINSQEEFDEFASSESTFVGKRISLNTDVTLNAVMFNNSGHQFAGVFDGNNHKITVTIEGADHVAAFGYLGSTGIIEDVEVHGTVTGISAAKVGGLVSTCYGEVRNCKNYATITSVANEVGGLVGYLCIGGNIYNSENNGVVEGSEKVGGIAGYAGGTSIIAGCTNAADITGQNEIGGVVGRVELATTISNNINSGNVSGTKSIGGIMGVGMKVRMVSKNVNNGNITGNVERYDSKCGVGGIIGSALERDDVSCTISENINNGKVTNEGVCTGGIIGVLRGSYWNISECTNNAVINGKKSLVGGIIGVTDFSNNTITNCTNSEIATVTGATFVGGIIGSLGYTGDRPTTKLSGCTNNATITATATKATIDGASKDGARVGGIAGFAYGSVVENSINTGTVRTLINDVENKATKQYVTGTANSLGLIVGYKTTKATVTLN